MDVPRPTPNHWACYSDSDKTNTIVNNDYNNANDNFSAKTKTNANANTHTHCTNNNYTILNAQILQLSALFKKIVNSFLSVINKFVGKIT